MTADVPDTLREGRYSDMRLLGEGGQGTTFEATDGRTGKRVAIKRFRVRGARSWKEVELAEREARVLASVSHDALPHYVEHFEDAGELYLVTEKIEGESLADLKKRGGRLSEGDIVRLLREAGDALDYLHGRAPPVIHRDLKPSNVIRRPDGSFCFIDFGSVRDRLRPEGGSTVVGTFGYMAPEQFQGRALPASDVYAMGATAITLLTGTEPEALPHRGLAIDVRAALRGSAGSSLTRVLEAMLEPDPERRASRIGPLLGRIDAEPRRDPDRREREKGASRHQRRREERAAKEARRREKKEARRSRKRGARALEHARSRLPGIVALAILMALTIAQLTLILVLRIGVPLLLTLLSLAFGKGLREAADRVMAAGKAAGEAIERAKETFAADPSAAVDDPPIRIRVEPRSAESASTGTTRDARAAGPRGDTRAEDEASAVEEAEAAARLARHKPR